MSIIVKGTLSKFNPAPEGVHVAVLVDVLDLGVMDWGHGKKPKVELRWQVAEVDPDTGERFIVRDWCTASLHEKSTLARHLAGLLGRAVTDAERIRGLDLESLLGRGCQLQVSHSVGKKGGTFANVDSCIPLPKGMPALQVSGYIRQRDRQDGDVAPPSEETSSPEEKYPGQKPQSPPPPAN